MHLKHGISKVSIQGCYVESIQISLSTHLKKHTGYNQYLSLLLSSISGYINQNAMALIKQYIKNSSNNLNSPMPCDIQPIFAVKILIPCCNA